MAAATLDTGFVHTAHVGADGECCFHDLTPGTWFLFPASTKIAPYVGYEDCGEGVDRCQ